MIGRANRLGFAGRMSGIPENFQPNVLLMGAFPNPGLLKRRRVSKRAVEIARGNGPQETNETLTACWNLYTHHAITGGKTLLADGNSFETGHWIWNEGISADIPAACGKRIILPGPASYPRMFGSQRVFDRLKASIQMKASIQIDGFLTPTGVVDWASRLTQG